MRFVVPLFRDTNSACSVAANIRAAKVLNLDTAGAGAPRRSSSFSDGKQSTSATKPRKTNTSSSTSKFA